MSCIHILIYKFNTLSRNVNALAGDVNTLSDNVNILSDHNSAPSEWHNNQQYRIIQLLNLSLKEEKNVSYPLT